MGRKNTLDQQLNTLEWAAAYKGNFVDLTDRLSISAIKKHFHEALKTYFALSGLSRSKSAPQPLVQKAYAKVFGVRVRLERSMRVTILRALEEEHNSLDTLFQGHFFGKSKKQGISVRAPLSTCNPTKLCAAACYAHDVLDAAPYSVIRGTINGVIAELFEFGTPERRTEIITRLTPDIKDAIAYAKNEARSISEDWEREARIRFSHVGEIAAFPDFANALAQEIIALSSGKVLPVIYTRHPNARKLDAELWVINFTLDKTSLARRSWAPVTSRLVFSAFGGEVNQEVDVNFLEHHRWSHTPAIGKGNICPTTLPEAQERTCDAVRCTRCFDPVKTKVVSTNGR